MTTQPSTRLDVYVNFPGHCEEAFQFYVQHLGARFVSLMRHSDGPPNPSVPDNWKKAVLHARIELGETLLMGADIPNAEPMRSAYLTLRFTSDAEADRVYELLAEGGTVFMEMKEMFYASRFAMLRDRFGISWMLLCEK